MRSHRKCLCLKNQINNRRKYSILKVVEVNTKTLVNRLIKQQNKIAKNIKYVWSGKKGTGGGRRY